MIVTQFLVIHNSCDIIYKHEIQFYEKMQRLCTSFDVTFESILVVKATESTIIIQLQAFASFSSVILVIADRNQN